MRVLPPGGCGAARPFQSTTVDDNRRMDRFLEFAGNNMLLVFALVTSFFLVVFTELRRKAAGLTSFGAADIVKLINNDAVVVDLRSNEAYARGHIVNSRNIPFDELDAKLDKLASFKSKPVVVVCEAGMTSTRAVDTLRKAGFESVYNLKGGMTSWSQDGMPVVTGKKTKNKK